VIFSYISASLKTNLLRVEREEKYQYVGHSSKIAKYNKH